MEEKWAVQLNKMSKHIFRNPTTRGESYPFILLCSRRQEFRERLFSGHASGEKFHFPSVHKGPRLPFYGCRGLTRLSEDLAGALPSSRGSKKSSLFKEVTGSCEGISWAKWEVPQWENVVYSSERGRKVTWDQPVEVGRDHIKRALSSRSNYQFTGTKDDKWTN